ncbi:Flavodoxin 2 [Thalassocella blandensis]|nr:Flavodoxin 2 [Thalassocella blandensis]
MQTLTNARACLIFGTDTGNTEEVGDKICAELAQLGCAAEMMNITDVSVEEFEQFDFLIFGIPTWDFGGIQGDWEDFEEQIASAQLQGKTVALYGLGDQLGYGYYFVDAMGWLYEHVIKTGAQIIGSWSTEGYFYDESRAVNQSRTHFCGLAIDDDQQFELTDARIKNWVEQIANEYQQLHAA